MPDPTPVAYSLVPWVRRGLSSLITGQPAANYASLPVSISVNGTPVNVPAIRMLGPGDITGLDPRAIIRTDPRDAADAFEPNYLAAVELALPDLPWMFTPSAPVNGRLQPWICLIVVPDGDGASIENHSGGVTVLRLTSPMDPKAELPDLSTIDAWAHAQVAGSGLSGAQLRAALDGDPPGRLARLICPRKLDPGNGYIACVVPTYRAGVNAGLGLPVDDHDLAPAWDATVSAPFILPVYYQFRFRTGPGGDFASLARKIGPPGAKLPPGTKLQAGTRPMDASTPGFGAAQVPGLILGLGGALRTVDSQSAPWPAGAQAAYEAQLRKALAPPAAADPVVTPPTYGRAQSGVDLPPAGSPPVWLSELNLDPAARAAASAGSQVVQRDQEALVASSWDQLGDIRKANQILRQAQLARQVAGSLYRRHLQTVTGDGTYLQITAALHSRVRLSLNGVSATLRAHIAASRVPVGAVSPAMRRIARPRGPIGRQLSAGPPMLVDRLNIPAGGGANPLQVVGPVQPPRGMIALDDVASAVSVSKMTAAALQSSPGWKIIGVVTPGPLAPPDPAVPVIEAGASPRPGSIPLSPLIDWSEDSNLPDILKGQRQNSPPPFVFPPDQAGLATVTGQFRTAASAMSGYLNTAPDPPADPPPLGETPTLSPVRAQLFTRIDPETTIQGRTGARISLGPGTDRLQPIRTGPAFPQPMYSALAQLSPEWMLPGVSTIPIDCATLLETNQRFVEAYLVGLNEEMSAVLLWREFPADRSLTFFQNFWGSGTPDIPAVRGFDPNGHLGDHTADQGSGSRFVLLIRANLFRRYPNAVISAIQAQWANGVRTLTETRQYPVFRGDVGGDITFFGFDIGDPRGSDEPAAGKPGWYFMLEEHLTEPRFGLEPDIPSAPAGTWNDMSWQDVTLNRTFLNPAAAPAPATREGVTWRQDAASMAFILMRRPVRVAMHGQALLGPPGDGGPHT